MMVDETDESKDPNYESLLASQIMAAGLARPEGFALGLKFMRTVRNGPFKAGKTSFVEDIKAILTSHFEAFPQTINAKASIEMASRSSDPTHVASLLNDNIEGLLDVARSQLGTHTAKIPNTQISGNCAFRDEAVFEAAAATPFLSSATMQSRLTVGAAGNAARGRAWRFLSCKLIVDGENVDIAADIAARGPVYDALASLVADKSKMDELADTIADAMKIGCGEGVAEGAKCLIWPTDDEGDILLSPLHPFAMHAEFGARVRHRRTANQSRLPTTYIKIGGTKPQNGGLVNNDLGGRHDMLFSQPPRSIDQADRSMYRFIALRDIPFRKLGLGIPAAAKLRKLMSNHKLNNDPARVEMDRLAEALARIALVDHSNVAAMIGTEMGTKVLGAIPTVLRHILTEGFDDRIEEHFNFAKSLAEHIAAVVEYRDQDLVKRFRAAAVRVLEAKFKG